MDPRHHLAKLSIGARRDLLRVLTSPAHVRADLIRQMHNRPTARQLAEVLMDLEADDLMRFQVIAVLEQST
jgi:hypothetical protein